MSNQQPVTAYIGLGSNLENPIQKIRSAQQAINAVDGVSEQAFSSLYHSPPMGPQDQPDYVNAVMALSTTLVPLDLLYVMQAIELAHGRVRKEQQWGARTLDLDILLYADQQINLPELIVPHIGISERAFVLYPLQEIAPELTIPGKGLIAEQVALCPLNGLKKVAE